MSFLLKGLFKKNKSNAENTTAKEVSAVEENTEKGSDNKEAGEKKSKHGQPGVCCGSCS